MTTILLPIKTVSTLNAREHWSKRARRAKDQRRATFLTVAREARATPLPVVVTLERLAPSNGLDGDNLQGAMKSVRDGIADCYGVDDRDERIEWRYSQRKAREYGVSITIAPAEDKEAEL